MENKTKDDDSQQQHPSRVHNRKYSERRERINQRAKAVWGIVADYAENSTVHGIRYLCEKNRPAVERMWWIIVIVVSISVCGKLIYEIYMKWVEEPVIVSFAEKPTPIWGISFPAITICLPVKALAANFNLTLAQESLERFKEYRKSNSLNKSDIVNIAQYEVLSHIMKIPQENDSLDLGRYNGRHYYLALIDISPHSNHINYTCTFSNAEINCPDYVTEVMTDEGICYSFNIINPREIYRNQEDHEFMNEEINKKQDLNKPPETRPRFWDIDFGYKNAPNFEDNSYPFRVKQNTETDLSITFTISDDDISTGFDFEERKYKLIIHSPAEIPKLSKGYLEIPFDHHADVNVRTSMMMTSDTLKNYSPQRRQCYYHNERPLKFFKIYTQKNCEQECLSNFTRSTCGCVKFSMPREPKTLICGVTKKKCYRTARKEFERNLFLQLGHANVKVCDCLPGCTLVTYTSEVLTTKEDVEGNNFTLGKISITLDKKDFIASRRSERYGMVDFIANFGGLLGLFMGVSIISMVEIVYYFTLRFMCNVGMRYGARRKTTKRLKRQEQAKALKNAAKEAEIQSADEITPKVETC